MGYLYTQFYRKECKPMKVTLVGVKNIEAFETNDGKTVDGVKLFIAYSDENTYGNVAESKYIDRKVFNDFGIKLDELVNHIGEVIDCEFNPKQKIVGITV